MSVNTLYRCLIVSLGLGFLSFLYVIIFAPRTTLIVLLDMLF